MSFRVAEKLRRSKVECDENGRKNRQECQLKNNTSEMEYNTNFMIDSQVHINYESETEKRLT